MIETAAPWYKSWFNSPWYTRLYQHRTELEAFEAVQLVRDVAGISTGARVLDLAAATVGMPMPLLNMDTW